MASLRAATTTTPTGAAATANNVHNNNNNVVVVDEEQQHQLQSNLEARPQPRRRNSHKKVIGGVLRRLIGGNSGGNSVGGGGRRMMNTTTMTAVTPSSASGGGGRGGGAATSSMTTSQFLSTNVVHRPINFLSTPHITSNTSTTILPQSSSPDNAAATAVSSISSNHNKNNVMMWLQHDCPQSLLGNILSYAGPQTIQVLNRTNQFWHSTIQQESTWKTLCEGMYKWKEGDEMPSSWKEYYRNNPCVPIDYSTCHAALSVLEKARAELVQYDETQKEHQRQQPAHPTTTVRILFRPGRYVLREPIVVDDDSSNKNNDSDDIQQDQQTQQQHVRLVLETMALPEALYPTPMEVARRSNSFSPALSSSNGTPKRRRGAGSVRQLRNLLNGCRRNDAVMMDVDDLDDDNADDDDAMLLMTAAAVDPFIVDDREGIVNNDDGGQRGDDAPIVLDQNMTGVEGLNQVRQNSSARGQQTTTGQNVESQERNETAMATNASRAKSRKCVRQATMVLRTRKHNEPLIRVRQGSITVRNMALKHISHGIDIWNGNAAVQIQPPLGPDDQPLAVQPSPSAVLDRVDVTSASGRGIVNIDGGNVTITRCYIHDCAATGIYVGGPGSEASIERTDVVRNGNGNTQHRRGIARGHSGIYLEQGNASILDCNVSQNSLTGISAVSPENAVLNLEESDLMSNGTFQLELPGPGTPAHRRSVTNNNNFATVGLARTRSGLVLEH